MTIDIEDAVRAMLAEPPVPPNRAEPTAELLARVDSCVRANVTRRRLLTGFGLAVAAVSVPMIVVSGVDAPQRTAASSAPSSAAGLSNSQIKNIALAAAKSYGDPEPTTIAYVKTTRAQALKQVDGVVERGGDESAPVIVIVMAGHFTVTGLGIGNATSTGDHAIFMIDSATGQGFSQGITSDAPDIAPLGNVVWLAPT